MNGASRWTIRLTPPQFPNDRLQYRTPGVRAATGPGARRPMARRCEYACVMAVGREPGDPAADHRAARVMCVDNGVRPTRG